jgi:hypothetical protein
MGWRNQPATVVGLVVALMVMAVPLPHVHAEPSNDGLHRVTTFSLTPESNQSLEVDLAASSHALVAWSCTTCQLEVSGTNLETTPHPGQTLRLEASASTTATLQFSSDTFETASVMVVRDLTVNHLTLRPAPGEATSGYDLSYCSPITDCISTDAGTLAARIQPHDDQRYLVTGLLESTTDEYIVFEVAQGDTVEWQWLAATHEINVEFYHQTTSEEVLLTQQHHLEEGFSELTGEPPKSAWWTAEEDGRFIARLSSNSSGVAWAAHVMAYAQTLQQSLVGANLSQGVDLLGHGSLTSTMDWTDVESVHLHARLGGATVQVDQFLGDAWVNGPLTVLEKGESVRVYPYPGTTAGQIHVLNTTVFALEILTFSFADSSGLEAPSYRPTDLQVDNESWPVLNLTSDTAGRFALAVHDTSDTYRLEVDGWEDSIHFVQFALDGDVEGLELQLWDIDQGTNEVLATDITRPVSDELSIGLQVGRGTHFFQIRYQNATEATPHLWGEHVEPRTYIIQASYTLIDEGEEPWYPPSEEAVYWGTVARWFMGLLFLVPALYLLVNVRRTRQFANEVASMKQRLAWYVARLDSGESDVVEARQDMTKALQAVAQLDWQDGMDAWGAQRTEHRTDDLAMAVWTVDERLAQHEGAWPLVVGLHVLRGTWELAALRFDAPQEGAFEVVHVEPRFLFQGEEVFLDEMNEGHKVYLLVELVGDAPVVDVELNGRVGNTPFAARIPVAIQR